MNKLVGLCFTALKNISNKRGKSKKDGLRYSTDGAMSEGLCLLNIAGCVEMALKLN